MKTHQKAFFVATDGGKPQGLDELNIALGRGWRVAHTTPLGGAGAPTDALCLAALVIVEREENDTSAALAGIEEEAEDFVDEIVAQSVKRLEDPTDGG